MLRTFVPTTCGHFGSRWCHCVCVAYYWPSSDYLVPKGVKSINTCCKKGTPRHGLHAHHKTMDLSISLSLLCFSCNRILFHFVGAVQRSGGASSEEHSSFHKSTHNRPRLSGVDREPVRNAKVRIFVVRERSGIRREENDQWSCPDPCSPFSKKDRQDIVRGGDVLKIRRKKGILD